MISKRLRYHEKTIEPYLSLLMQIVSCSETQSVDPAQLLNAQNVWHWYMQMEQVMPSAQNYFLAVFILDRQTWK